MSRNITKKIQTLIPDGIYRNIVVSKLISYIMYSGKKSKAEYIFYLAIKKFFNVINKYSISVFNDIVDCLKPVVEVKARRIGGATYQVPIEVNSSRSLRLSLKWIVISARKRKKEKTMVDKLCGEFIDIYNRRGNAYKKKIDTHRMAQANKAFSHYRW